MKTIAQLDSAAGMRLAQYLKDEGIAFSSQVITEDSGLVDVELSVEDALYDIACDAAEAWEKAEANELAKERHWVCPKCKTSKFEFVDDNSASIAFRCSNCGYSFSL